MVKIKKYAWVIMTLLAIGVGGYAFYIPFAPSNFVQNIIAKTPLSAFGHMIAGAIALIVGAFQFSNRIRSRFLKFHRWLGGVYVAAVGVSGISAVVLSLNSFGGLVTHFGFGMLAVCWIGSTLFAFRFIMQGDVERHKDWMLRSYGLTLAAVTLRLYIPIFLISGVEFEIAYQAIAWLCWVPNILVVEWFFIRRQYRKPAIVV